MRHPQDLFGKCAIVISSLQKEKALLVPVKMAAAIENCPDGCKCQLFHKQQSERAAKPVMSSTDNVPQIDISFEQLSISAKSGKL